MQTPVTPIAPDMPGRREIVRLRIRRLSVRIAPGALFLVINNFPDGYYPLLATTNVQGVVAETMFGSAALDAPFAPPFTPSFGGCSSALCVEPGLTVFIHPHENISGQYCLANVLIQRVSDGAGHS